MTDPSTKPRLNGAERHLLEESAEHLERLGRYEVVIELDEAPDLKATRSGRLALRLRELAGGV